MKTKTQSNLFTQDQRIRGITKIGNPDFQGFFPDDHGTLTVLSPTCSKTLEFSAHAWNSQEIQQIVKTPGLFLWIILTGCGFNI